MTPTCAEIVATLQRCAYQCRNSDERAHYEAAAAIRAHK